MVLSQLGRKRPAGGGTDSASASPAIKPPEAKRARVAQPGAPAPTEDFVPFDYSKAAVKDERMLMVLHLRWCVL